MKLWQAIRRWFGFQRWFTRPEVHLRELSERRVVPLDEYRRTQRRLSREHRSEEPPRLKPAEFERRVEGD